MKDFALLPGDDNRPAYHSMTPELLLRVIPLKLHVRNVTQTNGEQPVYELFCSLKTASEKQDEPPQVVEWSLWKSYEEFQAFDHQMRARSSTFAKMMVTVTFAPVHRVRVFFHQDQTPSFLEKRRSELDYYMQRIMLFSDVTDFAGGNGSKVLAAFIGAEKYIDCRAMSMTTTVSSPSNMRGSVLRQLNVDMHATFAPSSSMSSTTSSQKEDDQRHSHQQLRESSSSRKICKQEIEDELTIRAGEHQLKRFKKRVRAFRKENDPVVAAQEFVCYVNVEFDSEFAQWLLTRFVFSLKNDEKREVLMAAAGLRNDEPDVSKKARKCEQKMQQRKSQDRKSDSMASSTRLSRKKSSKQILARVEKISHGNMEHIEAFKQAAKALGKQEMTSEAFVAFIHKTFGEKEAHDLLLLVVDGVPQPEIQQQLRAALAM